MSSTPSLEKEAIIIYISGASPLVSKIGNPRKFGYEVTERNVHTLGEGEGHLSVTCDFGCSQLMFHIPLEVTLTSK